MKTLKIIQTLAKVGKIISKIVYICCIVGLVGCAVGLAALTAGVWALELGGVSLHSILQEEAGVSLGTAVSACTVGIFLCAGEIVLARVAGRYFENELRAGTPFTLDGAKELLRLGIYAVVVPIASNAAAQISHSIIALIWEGTEKLSLDAESGVTLGLAFIVVSLLCRYGAEQQEEELSELTPFLDSQGRLTALPAKHKKKLVALWYLAGKIEAGRQYTEPEINDLLDTWAVFHDHATLRRELYNKHILNRTPDGKLYWKEAEIPSLLDFIAKNI